MLDEDEVPEPKPLVDFAYLDDDDEKFVPDILDKYEGNTKFPCDFGKNKNLMNEDIRAEIHNLHKVKEPEMVRVPDEIDLDEDAGLIGPKIPLNLNYMDIEDKE